MVMMAVVPRGELHGKKEYTRACDSRQEKGWRFGFDSLQEISGT
jgi:hypothetical protein